MFEEKTDDYLRRDGGERHVRSIDDTCWISVLHRLTGFGHMEWETAICFADPVKRKHCEGSPFIVRGDFRDELAEMPREQLMAWFEGKRKTHLTTFDAMMSLISQSEVA